MHKLIRLPTTPITKYTSSFNNSPGGWAFSIMIIAGKAVPWSIDQLYVEGLLESRLESCHGSIGILAMQGYRSRLLGWFSWFIAFGDSCHCGGVVTAQSLFIDQ